MSCPRKKWNSPPACALVDARDILRTLCVRRVPRLLSTTRRILGNDDDAKDAVQEAFISAFRARAKFGGDSRVSTWLHRIAVNAALSKLRSRNRHPEDSIDELLPHFLPDGHHAEKFTAWTSWPIRPSRAKKWRSSSDGLFTNSRSCSARC